MGVCKGGAKALEFQKGSKVTPLLALIQRSYKQEAQGVGAKAEVLSTVPSETLHRLP